MLANPAPLMLTHLTNHVRAASLLFDFYPTVCASANCVRVGLCPFLIALIDLFITRFTRMPGVEAIEAEDLFTLEAASW